MANESTTTSLNDLLPSIVAEALFVAQERSIMRGLVRNYTLPMSSGKTITVPIYPKQTAAAVNEGTDLTNTEIATSGATLTIGEVGIMTTVTDLARNASASNVIADVGRLFGEAIAAKMDKDLTALFTGFSNAEGDYTTQITAASIFKAVAKLRGQGVDPAGCFCVIHPEIAYDLKSALTTGGSTAAFGGGYGVSDVANEAMRMGYVGMLAGVPVYETSNIANVTNAGDFPGAVFHRDALGLAMMQDIKIETQRDASLRADELVATAVYGVGELYDAYGWGLKYDSSI
jgi:N4-gp56 family major capsid protein